LKPQDRTPFGQLPYLEDGDVKLGQSMAIARYLSRKAGLQGDSDSDFAMVRSKPLFFFRLYAYFHSFTSSFGFITTPKSEQLIEEQSDLYNVLAKAQYAQNKAEVRYNKILIIRISLSLSLSVLPSNQY